MIKFRAWDKVAKVMIYNIEQTYDGLGYFQENEDIEDYVSDISFGCFADWLENDQFVIMQSTGLFDKNGKEIFEGDVIEIKRLIGPRFLVKKHKKSTQFVLQANFGREYFGTFGQDELEVIGNIYELESVEE